MKPKGNMILAGMEALLASGSPVKTHLNAAHDVLLDYLRNQKNEAPDWDLYPLSRTYFTQRA